MVAAPVQGDVDGIPKGSHHVCTAHRRGRLALISSTRQSTADRAEKQRWTGSCERSDDSDPPPARHVAGTEGWQRFVRRRNGPQRHRRTPKFVSKRVLAPPAGLEPATRCLEGVRSFSGTKEGVSYLPAAALG